MSPDDLTTIAQLLHDRTGHRTVEIPSRAGKSDPNTFTSESVLFRRARRCDDLRRFEVVNEGEEDKLGIEATSSCFVLDTSLVGVGESEMELPILYDLDDIECVLLSAFI